MPFVEIEKGGLVACKGCEAERKTCKACEACEESFKADLEAFFKPDEESMTDYLSAQLSISYNAFTSAHHSAQPSAQEKAL